METPPFRIGVFGRETLPTDGGADTLLRLLREKLGPAAGGGAVELVHVPAAAWSYRRQPLRYLWWRFTRVCGVQVPLWDFRPVCRRLRLDAAYVAIPILARIDIPYVFTLWDLGHRTLPEFPEMDTARESWDEREAMCRRMLPQASCIIAGNGVGAAEAREMYGLPAERVVAIPLPNPDFAGVEAALPAWAPRRPYFVYPAQGWPHKNHLTLIRALARLKYSQGEPFDLVLVGSDKGNNAHLRAAAARLGLADRVHFGGFVTRGELKALYQGAVGLVFPSLLGPNNLPPQEAAVLGCPMILSDLPGHREQLRDGALYVDPLHADAWGEAMVRLANDPALRADLGARARRVVADYTMENYAARLGEIFARLGARRALWGDWR